VSGEVAEIKRGSLADLPNERPFPGITRVSFSSELATVASYRFEPGARFPLHSHPQEQITLVDEGEVEMTIAGSTQTMRPGDWALAPAEVEHGLVAGPNGARVTAIVVPRRGRADEYTLADRREVGDER
jgi:quercetin dioxygenase-like cupin family protein